MALSRENAPRSCEEVELRQVGAPVRVGGAEADRAEDPGQEGDVVVHQLGVRELALLDGAW